MQGLRIEDGEDNAPALTILHLLFSILLLSSASVPSVPPPCPPWFDSESPSYRMLRRCRELARNDDGGILGAREDERERSTAMRKSAVFRTVRRTIKARRTAVPPARQGEGPGGAFTNLLATLDGASRRLEQSRRPMRKR